MKHAEAGRQGQQSEGTPATSGRPPSTPHKSSEEDVLRIAGQRYHVAHTVLLLLRMLQSYMTFQEAVPLLAAETARRAVDLLKVITHLTACTHLTAFTHLTAVTVHCRSSWYAFWLLKHSQQPSVPLPSCM